MRSFAAIFIALMSIGTSACSFERSQSTIQTDPQISFEARSPEPIETPTESKPTYPGLTIDQVFPVLHRASFEEGIAKPRELEYDLDGLTIHTKDYVPLTLEKKGEALFRFPGRGLGGYWATLVGISHLRGPDSKEIYVTASGPGGVCCTNYSIVDISSHEPRAIYHSEDFGSFRDAMEIFDFDGDGVYELVQFDSCLRYFRDDCGSCSPEPCVYFKYSNELGRYSPAKGIVQDFIRDGYARSEKWIDEKYSEWRLSKDPGSQVDLRRSMLAHVADLLHVGEEHKAWSLFRRYSEVLDANDERALRSRLSKCKAYKALKRAI